MTFWITWAPCIRAPFAIAIVVWQDVDISVHDFPVEWTGLLLFIYIAILLAYVALRDFIEDMSFGEILGTIKNTAISLFMGFLYPEDSGEYDEDEDEFDGYEES